MAVGIELAEWTDSGRLSLTAEGKSVAAELWGRTDLMVEERMVLEGRRLTQALVDRLLSGSS
jgi:hypothetical protein